ncbi:hypothetical protein GCM10028818_52360 [Spirosoma horti]
MAITTTTAPVARFEFRGLDGQLPYDLPLKETDAKLMKMALGLYGVLILN